MGLKTFLGLKKAPPPNQNSILPPECASWFEGKDFTSDWLSKKLPFWFAPLRHMRSEKVAVLELGSYEGRSAVALLEMFPLGHVTCVDIFAAPEVERRFDLNTSSYLDRCRKIKGSALAVMETLATEAARFDVIYLDAGKRRDDVFPQTALAWSLLKIGGTMIWDDLRWGITKKVADQARPGPAIELFARVFKGCMTEQHRGNQLIVRKTAHWPER
ncbi:class I SAM-dependent methyltransferase [Mesorhizobium sp. AR10]|uniref:class I SAM-dependent methyltransferase n=1 Tax=Mesorhizobium sp. AR10 TaxID=2865839 RepID=UPI002160D82C|nr:class I SAM-dependent methyltransferase [Mesorhizobium sp. AR10]UVK40470.1 class I SAM-dependent methyltransferase [Mesorhizobium sp. AR10]